MGYILIPVYSNEDKVDLLTGLVANQHFGYYEKSSIQSNKTQKFGEAVSEFTGEVFRVQEVNIQDSIQRIGTFHVNLLGSRGSHYIGKFIFDKSGELTYLRVSKQDSKAGGL
jgi:hypothetical protein